MKELANADFYVVKFSSAQGNLYCVRKTDSTWKTKKRAGAIHTFFKSKTLKLDEAPSFHIAKDFDMAVLANTILMIPYAKTESPPSWPLAARLSMFCNYTWPLSNQSYHQRCSLPRLMWFVAVRSTQAAGSLRVVGLFI